MGRQLRRVPLDFDWPVGRIWPGFMRTICTEDIGYITRGSGDDDCTVCKHFAKLAGLKIQSHGCPQTNIEPPEGDGWQLWETVSEGSPITPVFATQGELVDFMATPAADGRGGWAQGYSRNAAEAFVTGDGWAPSGAMVDGAVMNGVEGMAKIDTVKP